MGLQRVLDTTVINWMIVFNEVKKYRLCSLRAFSTHIMQKQYNDEDNVGVSLKGRLTKQKTDTFVSDCKKFVLHLV